MENKKSEKLFNNFQKSIHFWGRLTIAIALIATLMIPSYLTFVLGHYPEITDIISGLISIVGFVGVIWFVEPISYFPTLGPAGTYMSFLSGNIGNMRMPVIAATQDALELKPGTEESEVAGIFAIISSTITNLVVLGIVMVAGQAIISSLPASVLASFDFALPGVLGAMMVMMGSKVKKNNLVVLIFIALATMIFIRLSPNFLPESIYKLISSADVGIVALLGIAYSLYMAKKDIESKDN
ncbi:hypothetical protein [Facklamia sp. 7083-14-GEN3]|uniref:hypothetical protein n=1 Tax=Facklamia sp. 7083-14-GEN3 TaxID=2973478 RepID=UPI00215D09F3|nr:hypothetical protein [Facklamia sp. 7083-14-GEN3]MCR8969052.1 hypothetical protein [Facklamia sp. 7083-14-GEN3]